MTDRGLGLVGVGSDDYISLIPTEMTIAQHEKSFTRFCNPNCKGSHRIEKTTVVIPPPLACQDEPSRTVTGNWIVCVVNTDTGKTGRLNAQPYIHNY